MRMSPGKLKGLDAVSNSRGVIAAAAMDQRGALRSPVAKARGVKPEEVTDQQMKEFKSAVSRVLTPHASAILLDPDTGRRWPSVTNIGYRPTFDGHDLSIETFLLRPLEPPNPERLSVAFWRRLRHERKFPSPAELREQILRDVATTEKFFRRLRAAQKELAG